MKVEIVFRRVDQFRGLPGSLSLFQSSKLGETGLRLVDLSSEDMLTPHLRQSARLLARKKGAQAPCLDIKC